MSDPTRAHQAQILEQKITTARQAIEFCRACGGAGTCGRNFVTADMASDAGEPEMVGMELEPDRCEECHGAGVIEDEHVGELIAAVEALAALRAPSPVGTCVWSESGDGPWESSCGKTWEFIDDGPIENGMVFCLKCGKPVALSASQEK